jgi:lipopolysaccharide biosynthesis regulator YciM
MLFWLLPLAAFSGWWIGRAGRDPDAQQSQKLTHDYLTGLNFLLNEQPDKAVDLFIKMLQVDSETVETHLALGSLFRRRGEVDKAIRIHQNLIARPNLTQRHRMQSLFELGTDYMRAGVLDRAESLFLELVKLNYYVPESLRHLLQIYEKEGDYEKAIDIAHKYQLFCSTPMAFTIAHYYCELAEQALKNNQADICQRYIKHASSIDAHCVRAQILQGQQMMAQKEYQQAIRCFMKISHKMPEYVSEIVAPLAECFEATHDTEAFKTFIKVCFKDNQGIALLRALPPQYYHLLENVLSFDEIMAQLQARPSMRALQVVLSIRLRQHELPNREDLQLLMRVMEPLLTKETPYVCEHCGYAVSKMYWHCPSCHHWGTIKPSTVVKTMGAM